MAKKLYFAILTYVTLGLVGGLFYREFTKGMAFTDGTQLSVVHTHFLMLGVVTLLGVLALEKVYRLSQERTFRGFFIVFNAGLLITGAMMVIKGILQVTKSAIADSGMIAGIAGLGHITLTAAFVLLLIALKKRIWADEEA